jgi:hypothetical protein
MKLGARLALPLLAGVAVPMMATVALAQNIGDTGGASAPGAAPASPPSDANNPNPPGGGSSSQTTVLTAPSQTTTTTYTPLGLPAAGTNLDGHLPSSSRGSSDTSRSGDGFDLGAASESGGPMHGSGEGAAVLGKHATSAPSMHQVQRGDTLWDLCSGYFQNPWLWPKVWSYNPQIQNPHWIYPGDQVRLRIDAPVAQKESILLGSGRGHPASGGFMNRRPVVPRDTIFLRGVGYIDDPQKDVWGELVGAQEEQMLLTQGNNVFLIMRPGVDVRLGQLLTVFHSVRTPGAVPGARRPPGEIVAFKGTVKVDDWNPTTRMARGKLIESLDVVERGDKIGPVGRRFEVVPPKRNEIDTEARVLTSMYPHEVMGQNQIAFIDRGAKDGLVPGNRLFLTRRGDGWRRTLQTTTTMGRTRVRTDVPEHVQTDVTPLNGKTEDFPEEVTGELRVLRVDEYSSVTLVTSTKCEIEPGDRAVARKGY